MITDDIQEEIGVNVFSHYFIKLAGSPGSVLNAAQRETKGHVATQFLRRAHQPLQIILRKHTVH